MAQEPARGARTVVSLRLDPDLLARVTARAAAQGVTRTALVERYIRAGMLRDDHPLIEIRRRGDRPVACLAGRRLEVRHVIDRLRAMDGDRAGVAEDLGIGLHLVEACVAYYAEHRDEEDARAAAIEAEGERMLELHRAAGLAP